LWLIPSRSFLELSEVASDSGVDRHQLCVLIPGRLTHLRKRQAPQAEYCFLPDFGWPDGRREEDPLALEDLVGGKDIARVKRVLLEASRCERTHYKRNETKSWRWQPPNTSRVVNRHMRGRNTERNQTDLRMFADLFRPEKLDRTCESNQLSFEPLNCFSGLW